MTFHSSFIDVSSGIVWNGTCRVAAAKIFKVLQESPQMH